MWSADTHKQRFCSQPHLSTLSLPLMVINNDDGMMFLYTCSKWEMKGGSGGDVCPSPDDFFPIIARFIFAVNRAHDTEKNRHTPHPSESACDTFMTRCWRGQWGQGVSDPGQFRQNQISAGWCGEEGHNWETITLGLWFLGSGLGATALLERLSLFATSLLNNSPSLLEQSLGSTIFKGIKQHNINSQVVNGSNNNARACFNFLLQGPGKLQLQPKWTIRT